MKTAPLPNPRPQRDVTIIYLPSRNCGRLKRYRDSKARRTPPPPPPPLPTPERYLDRSGVWITTNEQPKVIGIVCEIKAFFGAFLYVLVALGLAILVTLMSEF